MTDKADITENLKEKKRTDAEADKIDIIIDKVKSYQDAKLEMFKKSREAILEQQKADLEFCKDLDSFFREITKK